MLDFETLGQKPDTTVLSLGAVFFTREGILKEKEWVFDLKGQFNARRSVTADTLLWWMQQSEAARKVFTDTKKGIMVKDFLHEMNCLIANPDTCVWGNGATFDVGIIENMYHTFQMELPWKFWNVRCYRTLKMMFGIEKVAPPREGTHHNALDDARYQAKCLMGFLNSHQEIDR